MAISLIVLFGMLYGGLYWVVRRRLTVMGTERKQAQKDRFKLASEVLGGIKEIKLLGLEETLLAQYGAPSKVFAETMASSKVLSLIPKYALETVGFGGVLVIVLYWLWRGGSLHEVLPLLGVYAFATYRILPGLQTVFAAMATIRFNLVVVDSLAAEIGRDLPARSEAAIEPLEFQRSVALQGVVYLYPTGNRPALGAIDIAISRSEWVALVGPTGSGKSTLADIVLGLLHPSGGRVLVDGVPLDEHTTPRWQKNVGYVPQQIFLIDDTVARNIAFGVAPQDVDDVALRAAARIAQIDDFVMNELPERYDTVVGERGVRVSGGQRQRIGIARSLYRRPSLLILDEATSAVDGPTEAAFFDALRVAMRETTVISIAHRLSTTKEFDRVVLLERGSVVAIGSPQDAIGGQGAFAVLHTPRDDRNTISA
jgi:ABC-type multidrug transport system fused ATPase/permease subunit